MKLTNADVNAALAAMTQVCGGGNRLATLPALRAARIKAALAKAWEPCEEHRVQLCQDHGKLDESGTAYVFESAAARRAFEAGWQEVLGEQREIEVETLTLAEVEAGHYRTEGGKKESGLDLSPDHLGVLVRVGIVTAPEEEGA